MEKSAIIKIGIVLFIVYHILTLPYSPLPWFDEVAFVSMTHSYYTEGSFLQKVRILECPEPRLEYGPVYFILQAFVAKLFGFSSFIFRFNGLIFGFLNIYLVYRIGRKLRFSTYGLLITIALLCLSPVFNQSMHSGRMDMLALFFFLSSLICLMDVRDRTRKSNILALCAGLLLAGAMLTTPRILFAFPVCVFLFIYNLYYSKAWINILFPYLIAVLSFGLVYFCWIYFAFGGISSYISYYMDTPSISVHIGGASIGPNYQLGITFLGILMGLVAFFKAEKSQRSYILPIACIALICFHAIVGEASLVYYAFAMPFSALLIGWSTDKLKDKFLFRLPAYGLLLSFAAIFTFKSLVIWASLPQRDEDYYAAAYAKYIPPKEKVAGDFAYYYMAIKNNNPFDALGENGSENELAEHLLKNRVKYIVINKGNTRKAAFEQLLLNKHYRLISIVENKKKAPVFSGLVDYLPWFVTTDYACSIYQLIDKGQDSHTGNYN